MTRQRDPVGQRLASATRAVASWFGKRPAPAKRGAKNVARDAALRVGAIEDEPAEVGLDAVRLAADEGLAALAKALENGDPAVRARALSVIVELSEQRATRLLKAMMFDPDASVRRAAAVAAPRVEGLGVVASLIVALRDPDGDVRRAAAAAITRMTDQNIELAPSDASISDERHAELRAWWKEQRIAELTRDSAEDAAQ
jgi:HEAT repeats